MDDINSKGTGGYPVYPFVVKVHHTKRYEETASRYDIQRGNVGEIFFVKQKINARNRECANEIYNKIIALFNSNNIFPIEKDCSS